MKYLGAFMVSVRKKHTLYIRNSFIVSLLLAPFFGYANEITMDDLDEMQAQRVLYEAKAAVNKARLAAGDESGLPAPPPSAGIDGRDPQTVAPTTPRLAKINGNKAELILPNGESVFVTTGMLLPGGQWQVQGVGLSGVTLKNIKTSKITVIN